ncbi:MAG: hypothetical protein RR280_05340 [Bacteroidaceae bacterium]
MKKICLFLLSGMSLFFASCDNGVSYEYHSTSVFTIPGTSGAEFVFADQEKDSLFIKSTDSWTAQNTSDWLTMEKKSFKVPPGVSYSVRSYMYTPINATGAIRSDKVIVSANGRDYIKEFKQLPWINIILPLAQLTNSEDVSTTFFKTSCTATATSDSIIFFLRAPAATLTSNSDWITFSDVSFTNSDTDGAKRCNSPKRCKTILRFSKNTSTEPREAIVTLTTSNKNEQTTSTKISIFQAGKK